MPVMVLLLAVTGCSSSDSSGNPGYAVDDAALGALTVSSGTLTPAFDSDVVSYAVTVARGTTTFQVTPTARSPRAYAIQVKQGSGAFTVVPSGAPSPSYPVPAVGSSSAITVRVIAENQTTIKAYVVGVTQAAGDASLRSLAVSAGSLSPTFVSSVVAYSDAVPFGTASFTVTPTVSESHATVQVRLNSGVFASVPSGSASGALAVPAYGSTSSVTVRVTAQNGATQDYTIQVSQAAPSADATLQGLAVSGASLNPAFVSATGAYTATLSNGTTSFTVTPTVNESHATVQVKQDSGSFASVASGTVSGPLAAPAAGGATTVITLRVTAQDGSTTQDYTITVDQTAALSTDATLQSLSISDGSLSPAFAAGTSSYTVELPNPTATFTVTPTASDTHATIQVSQDGAAFAPVASGSASGPLAAPAAGGATTTITVQVTAQDGVTTQQYQVAVTQAAPSTDAALQALTIPPGNLNPAFGSATFDYTTVLPFPTATFTVTPAANEPHATIVVDQDGTAVGSAPVTLNAPTAGGAPTVIVVHVTAQDGIATQDYTITVSQLAAPQEVVAFFPLYADTLCAPTGEISGQWSLGPNLMPASWQSYSYPTFRWFDTWHDPSGATTVDPGVTTVARAIWVNWTTSAVSPVGPPPVQTDNWVQFAVSTSAGKTLTVDQISFFGGSGGTKDAYFAAAYSTSADFWTGRTPLDSTTGRTLLDTLTFDASGMFRSGANNDMYLKGWTGQQPIVVPPGATLYVRIFPWLKTQGTSGKYLLLQSFKVHGTVQ
jgi:hypothetical protein